jgi:Peptidase A4 family
MSKDPYSAFKKKLPFPVVPTNIPGAFATKGWPRHFDLETASPSELMKHGVFWRHPKSEDDPRLIAAWQEGVAHSRKIKDKDWLVPELEPQIGTTHLHGPITRRVDGTFTGGAWSGGTLPGVWSGVIGQWEIPTVSQPSEPGGANPPGGWTSSSWVGLDGAYGGSNDVLQAGVQQQVDSDGVASYVAWYEWFIPPQAGSPPYIYQTNIPNFPVSPGDTVFCSAQYIGHTAGHLYFLNTTNNSPPLSITLAPPPSATHGDSAEWIMECNDYGEPKNSLPFFTPVKFSGGVACSGSIPSGNPINGDTWAILDAQGLDLTSTLLGDGTVGIFFVGNPI